jgi:hypothetical protein
MEKEMWENGNFMINCLYIKLRNSLGDFGAPWPVRVMGLVEGSDSEGDWGRHDKLWDILSLQFGTFCYNPLLGDLSLIFLMTTSLKCTLN